MGYSRTVDIDGRQIRFELGELAKQADGATVVSLNDTMVLVTACASTEPRPGAGFLPLTVDYRENTYAGGRIPGGWFKREGRPTEREILTCRVIDRPIRPLFPEGYFRDTQVIGLVLSADGENDPDVLALNGASMSLMAAPRIPFTTPIGGVRVGRIDGRFVAFPTHSERESSDLDLVVAGTENAIVMVECGARELPESVILDALEFAHGVIRTLIATQKELVEEMGVVKEPFEPQPKPWPEELERSVRERWTAPLTDALRVRGKLAQKDAIKGVEQQAMEALPEESRDEQDGWVKEILHAMVKEITRETILGERQRLDGRAFDEIRPVACQAGLLPRTHGSALFTRGETQALVTCTLGTKEDAQIIEAFEGESHQRFLLHYNFPPFSVGEVRFLRSPSRREIGHGNLARRALTPVLPGEDEFPYTIRVVSDILESNGSSSMATVCGGSMSLMDAGVPLKKAVAGVAMGLVSDGERYAVLTDIAGQEDHYGDMDFKVAGTRDGITALQMDIKIAGLSRQIMEEALEQANRARMFLLDRMAEAIPEPRADISPYAPRIFTMKVDPDVIRLIIGPGGKTIRGIVDATGARIEVEDDGTVRIATNDQEAADKAMEIINAITKQPEVGEVYDGVVKRLEPYGAFVEILPNQDGLLHISEISTERIPDIRDVLSEGDTIKVKIIGIDGNDRIKLSHRVLIEEEERAHRRAAGEDVPEPDPEDRRRRDDRGGRGGRPHRDRTDRGRGGRGGHRGGGGGRHR